MSSAKKFLRNKLNHLDAKSWLKFQKSWFIHNPPPRRKDVLQHPAKFPETLAQEFIEFFTKKGQTVLDPMVGTGSALVACLRSGRNGIGIELNPKYARIARQIVEAEIAALGRKVARLHVEVINADAADAAEHVHGPVDYIITSPPYWDMLRARGAETQKKRRATPGLDVFYSDDPRDLGNVDDYEEFLARLCAIYEALHPLLKPRAYMTLIVKNVKKGGKIYPLAWDLAKRLERTYTLKDEKVWCLPPEEGVWTEHGLLPIGNIAVGERVLSHMGQLETVTRIMRRPYEGVLIRVKPALLGGAVRLTPEHEVLVLKRRMYHHANGERFWEPFERSYARDAQWLPTRILREGDAVAYPVCVEEQDVNCISTRNLLSNLSNWREADGWLETRGRGKHGRGRVPAELEVNEAFLRLAGWYLSEGSCSEAGVNIANYQAEAREEIRELLWQVFQANSADDGKAIWCRSRTVGQVLGALFGRRSHEKRLPEVLWHLPVNKLAILLTSLWQGDGHMGSQRVTYKTVSERLTWGVAYATIRLGAIPYIQQHPGWFNLIYSGGDANRLRAALGHPALPVNHLRAHHWNRDGLIWLPIRSIQKEQYRGEVCNLSVANTNSYTTLGFVVHNCQDNQRLSPYGLGNAWVSNTFHHYCLQFRKE
jgi:DNA modification methylase